MRNISKMIKILKEAEKQDDGIVQYDLYIDNSPEQNRRQHSVNLLIDAGLMKRVGDGVAEITNDGYDFLNGYQNHIEYSNLIVKYMNGGSTFLKAIEAAKNILNL